MKPKTTQFLANAASWWLFALAGTGFLLVKKRNMFSYGKNSEANLQGVNETLVKVMRRALYLSEDDFSIVDGLRTEAEGRANLASGASQAARSTHLDGLSVDIHAVESSPGVYVRIARAVAKAAEEMGVQIRWGGAWEVLSTRTDPGFMLRQYEAKKRLTGGKPFEDLGHFELFPKSMLNGRWVYTPKGGKNGNA